MKRLAHALIAVATGIEQATLVWESLKAQQRQPEEPPQRRTVGFTASAGPNTDLRDNFSPAPVGASND